MSAYLHPAHLPTKSYEFLHQVCVLVSALFLVILCFVEQNILFWQLLVFFEIHVPPAQQIALTWPACAMLKTWMHSDFFAGVRGQYCSSDQLPCCLFLDAIICPHTSRYENLLEQEAIEQIVVVQSANNNWMLQRTKIQQRILNTFTPVLCPEMSQRSPNHSSFLLATN